MLISLVNKTDCHYPKQLGEPLKSCNSFTLMWQELITQSLQGNLYFNPFIDDFTRMSWILFFKFKHEEAGVFVKFKEMVENQSGCKIQFLRSDNGKEYTSTQFNMFCEEAGIEHQLTTPYTPQQNGVSERRNRYVMEMARCMLHEKVMPKHFWA